MKYVIQTKDTGEFINVVWDNQSNNYIFKVSEVWTEFNYYLDASWVIDEVFDVSVEDSDYIIVEVL